MILHCLFNINLLFTTMLKVISLKIGEIVDFYANKDWHSKDELLSRFIQNCLISYNKWNLKSSALHFTKVPELSYQSFTFLEASSRDFLPELILQAGPWRPNFRTHVFQVSTTTCTHIIQGVKRSLYGAIGYLKEYPTMSKALHLTMN